MVDYKPTKSKTKKSKRRYDWGGSSGLFMARKNGYTLMVASGMTGYDINIWEDPRRDKSPVYVGHEKSIKSAEIKAEEETNRLIRKYGRAKRSWYDGKRIPKRELLERYNSQPVVVWYGSGDDYGVDLAGELESHDGEYYMTLREVHLDHTSKYKNLIGQKIKIIPSKVKAIHSRDEMKTMNRYII